MFKIIRKNLAGYVAEAVKAYQSSGEKMHIAIVSALYNQATSGDTTLINTIHSGLRSNDKQALRLFIRRASIVNGLILTNAPQNVDVLDTETMQAMLKIGAVVSFSKDKFTTIQNPSTAAAKSFAILLEKRLLNPDGEIDKMVFERNNFAEHKLLGDADVIKSLLKTTNEALDNVADNKTYALSEAIRNRLQKIKTMLEVNLNQASLDKA